jgi:hypothetical protein
MNTGLDVKLVSGRVGHANMAVTLQVHSHRSTGLDRAAARHLGGLIAAAVRDDEHLA